MSKAVRKAKRAYRTAAERQLLMTKLGTDFVNAMNGCGLDISDMHNCSFNVVDSIEKRMLQLGMRIPTYTRTIKGTTKATSQNFCLCRRCACREFDENGDGYCQDRWSGPKKERFYFSDDDGCTRGIPSKEFRK